MKILTLSHGQSTIERGFPVNKEVCGFNMYPETLIAWRSVYDGIKQLGGDVHEILITKDMLSSCWSARQRYDIYLSDLKKNKEESAEAEQKAVLKKIIDATKRELGELNTLIKQHSHDSDQLHLRAEKEKKLVLVCEANAMRSKKKEKENDAKQLEKEISTLEKQLKD